MFCSIRKFWLAGFASLAKAGAGVALLSLAACSSQRDVSEGVQLILNTEALEPTTTFELRFDEVVAAPEEMGQSAANSPLIITPPIAGSFVWLSRRGGLFTPSEPPELGQRYRFSLRAGLQSYRGDLVGQASRLPRGTSGSDFAGETPGVAGETPAPLPAGRRMTPPLSPLAP